MNLSLALGYFLALFLLLVPLWLRQNFGHHFTFDTILFHFFSGPAGILGTESQVVYRFFETAVMPPFVLVSSFFYFNNWQKDNPRGRSLISITSFFLLLIVCISPLAYFDAQRGGYSWKWFRKMFLFAILAPGAIFLITFTSSSLRRIIGIKEWVPKVSARAFCLFSILVSVVFFGYITKVHDTFAAVLGPDHFSDLYYQPKNLNFNKEIEGKNLILIYFESLENNLRNKAIFGENLIDKIDDIPGRNVDHFRAAPGTEWSIAGMVASQCALPVKPFLGNGLGLVKVFLPNAICLGDVLRRYGYQQFFLVGPVAGFSGMDHFYKSHGFDEVIGKLEWEKRGLEKNKFTGWGNGLQDDTLFDEALKLAISISRQRQLFNLTLITTDTHAPEGFLSPRCTERVQLRAGLRDAFKCSAYWVSDFIKQLEQEKILKNTVVVILGDHPFMDSDYQSHLFPDPREIYFKVIDSDNESFSRNKMTHFDVTPTILHLLKIMPEESEKFGLGISLFSRINSDDYENHFRRVVNKEILNRSEVYDSLWSVTN